MSEFDIPRNIKPNNLKSLGVLGYLIVLNDQIHSYEMKALENYLNEINLKIEDTCLDSIIKGMEESVSYASSYEAFSGEDTDVKLSLLYLMFVLACVDNHFAEEEDQYINTIRNCIDVSDEQLKYIQESASAEAEELRAQNNKIFIRKVEVKKNLWQRIIDWIKEFFCKLFGIKKQNNEDLYIEYKDTIKKCADIAAEDLSIVEPAYARVLKKCNKTVESIKEYKNSLSLETGISAGVAKTVETFVDVLNGDVLDQTNQELFALKQKKSTISDFTISLIGRTKAGKSTLHSILTQQGRDRIGVGKQRTTRYNWVYQWNLLRIIDTPGVGSAEADGRKDEEIAENVLGESDIICFVVADDSILKDILEFIEKIAALNKPIIILLNHKENIRPDVKFRRFIDNPMAWLEDGGEASLKGHENRIRKYAASKGFEKLINVYPVFLLPALMSDEEAYSEHRELLWKSSNIQNFINQISDWVLESGVIKRSQTILDETVHVFERAKAQIAGSETVLDDQIKFLEKQHSEKFQELQKEFYSVVDNIHTLLEDRFEDLAVNQALIFAEEYVSSGKRNGKDVPEKWEAFIEKIEFEKQLQNDIQNEIKIYQDKADRTMQELFEDLICSVNLSMKINKIDIPIQTNLRMGARFAFGAIGLVGTIITIVASSNPVGWALGIAGAIGGALSFLFQSKEKRMQTAIDKIYKSLRETIEKETPANIETTLKEINKVLSSNLESVDSVFKDLSKGLARTKEMADGLINEYSGRIDVINRVYAWRIIKFLESDEAKIDFEAVREEILNVDRSENGVIKIQTKSVHNVNTEKLKNVLAEDVLIERRE